MRIAFVYYSNASDAIGIDNKMLSYKKAAGHLNFDSIIYKIQSLYLSDELINIWAIIKSNENVYLIRYNNSRNIFLFLMIVILKIRKKRIILDVPTPLTNYLKELNLSSALSFKRFLIKFSTYILGPLPFFISDLVVQYAEESAYFNPKLVKSILIGNGIDANQVINLVDSINSSMFVEKYNFNTNYLNVVSLGSVAPWHGWDKLINLISKINKTREIPLRYYIIGDGIELDNLKKMVIQNNVCDSVFFLGKMKREEYVPFISCCDLGIGSLAWDRVGVTIASPLKSREYICCGIPVVYSSFDIDISNSPFGFEISTDSLSIYKFTTEVDKLALNKKKSDYFEFARGNLDMKIKLFYILSTANII